MTGNALGAALCQTKRQTVYGRYRSEYQAGKNLRAKVQKEADDALAAKKLLDALMVKLQASMEEEREKLKEVMMAMDEALRAVSQMINGATENMSQITANIGKRAMV